MRYIIFIVLIIIPIIACNIEIEGTIWEKPEDTRAIIQSDQDCDDCVLESK